MFVSLVHHGLVGRWVFQSVVEQRTVIGRISFAGSMAIGRFPARDNPYPVAVAINTMAVACRTRGRPASCLAGVYCIRLFVCMLRTVVWGCLQYTQPRSACFQSTLASPAWMHCLLPFLVFSGCLSACACLPACLVFSACLPLCLHLPACLVFCERLSACTCLSGCLTASTHLYVSPVWLPDGWAGDGAWQALLD